MYFGTILKEKEEMKKVNNSLLRILKMKTFINKYFLEKF